MLGLQRGTVRLLEHQDEWCREAAQTIAELRELLRDAATDIQHVGSTAIPAICAKPVLDIVIGMHEPAYILPYTATLRDRGFVLRGEDVPGQLLLVKGDFVRDLRTHHIHVVTWNGPAWQNYLNFRDYLNTFPDKALAYSRLKQRLAALFPDNRRQYTEGKQPFIAAMLAEARQWRAGQRLPER